MHSERIALRQLENYRVSTVLIREHNGLHYFETMVFDKHDDDVWCARTTDRSEALRNHAQSIEAWKG